MATFLKLLRHFARRRQRRSVGLYTRWHLLAAPESLQSRRVFANPSLFIDLVPGNGDSPIAGGWASSVPVDLTEFKGEAYFVASGATYARGIWKTDGTAGGTASVAVIRPKKEGPGYTERTIDQLTVAGEYLYFRETDDKGYVYPRLWRTDGTATGTVLLRDFGQEAAGQNATKDILNLTCVNGTLFFAIRTKVNRGSEYWLELWRSDGSPNGTAKLGEFAKMSPARGSSSVLNGPQSYESFLNLGSDVYFHAQQKQSQSSDLVKWDSASQSFLTLHRGGSPTSLGILDGKVVFASNVWNAKTGMLSPRNELWQTDGTVAGTSRLLAVPDGGRICGVAEAGGRFFVAASGSRNDVPGKVMVVDGEVLRTVYSTGTDPFNPKMFAQDFLFQRWGSDLLVVERSSHARLVKISSSRLDASVLGEFRSWGGPGSNLTDEYVIHPNGRLYFAASKKVSSIWRDSETELWESDGTAAGTRVYDVTPGRSSGPEYLALFKNDIFYSCFTPESGTELWRFKTAGATQPPPSDTTVPGAPTKVVGTPGNRQVSLTWEAPASNGGVAITDYVVQFKTAASSAWTTFADGTSTATSATVTGLANGTSYVFRVAAVNSVGTGGPSDISPSVAPVAAATVPGAPTKVVGTPGNRQVSLTWEAPASNGGVAITDYVVQFKTARGGTWRTFADGTSTATSATVTGLANGTSYVFRVAAVNSSSARIGSTFTTSILPVGQGLFSATSAAVTPRTVPGAPRSVRAAVRSNVGLYWHLPVTNGGVPITDYVVQFKPAVGTEWTTFADRVSPSRGAAVSGLSAGVSYVFRVAAVNSAGIGEYYVTPYAVTLRAGGTRPIPLR
jgi:ELWxxDGT repeat protein